MNAPSLAGKWIGGPHNTTITIEVSSGSEVTGTYRCPSGGIGEFSGKLHRGTMARCLWTDPDVPGAGSRSVNQLLEIQLDPSGNGWTATSTLGSGGSGGRWTAKRVVPRQRRPGERLSTAGICKNKEIFERLTQSKSTAQLDLEVGRVAFALLLPVV
jgi:hypothetical protein